MCFHQCTQCRSRLFQGSVNPHSSWLTSWACLLHLQPWWVTWWVIWPQLSAGAGEGGQSWFSGRSDSPSIHCGIWHAQWWVTGMWVGYRPGTKQNREVPKWYFQISRPDVHQNQNVASNRDLWAAIRGHFYQQKIKKKKKITHTQIKVPVKPSRGGYCENYWRGAGLGVSQQWRTGYKRRKTFGGEGVCGGLDPVSWAVFLCGCPWRALKQCSKWTWSLPGCITIGKMAIRALYITGRDGTWIKWRNTWGALELE